MKQNLLVFIGLFLLVVVSRNVTHLWNLTMVGGAFLMAGAYFQDKKIAVLLVLSSMLASDYLLGFHNQMLAVYGAYLVVLALGFTLHIKSALLRVFGTALSGSLLFFFITNFAVWFEGRLYPQSWAGLLTCYEMALPFFRHQLLGDLVSSVALFALARHAPEALLAQKVRK